MTSWRYAHSKPQRPEEQGERTPWCFCESSCVLLRRAVGVQTSSSLREGRTFHEETCIFCDCWCCCCSYNVGRPGAGRRRCRPDQECRNSGSCRRSLRGDNLCATG